MEELEMLKKKFEQLEARQVFLKDAIFQLVTENIDIKLRNLDVKEGEIVVFNIPNELAYDPEFFSQVGKLLQTKGIAAFVIHSGIEINIIRESNAKKEIKDKRPSTEPGLQQGHPD